MKKFAYLVVAGMLATSIAPVYASAISVKPINVLSVESDILTESIDVDGVTIPSGTVAVTVSVDNNDGLSYSATKLDIGSADVVTNDMGYPVVMKRDVLNNSIVASAKNDNILVVSSASATECNIDGEMFTFFVSDNYSGTVAYDILKESLNISSMETNSAMASSCKYRLGDVDHDGWVDACDASAILTATTLFPDGATELSVTAVDNEMARYFPNFHHADVADVNKDTFINEDDACAVLQFYSITSATFTNDDAYNYLSVNFGNYTWEQIVKVHN